MMKHGLENIRKYKHNAFNANKILKNKNENSVENDRYNNGT